MVESFIIVWLGVILAQVAPGPNLVAVAGTALGEGRRPAMFVTLGIALGVLVWSAATAGGLAILLDRFPLSLVILRLLGGSYLLWLALRALRAAIKGEAVMIRADHDGEMTDKAAFLRGASVVLSNPKAAMMWVAVATFLFGAGLNGWQILTFAPLGMLSALVIYGFYAWAFSTRVAMAGYARAARGIEAVFAGAFGLLGGRLIYDGLSGLRP